MTTTTVTPMTSPSADLPVHGGARWGPLFASIWLFFLLDPAREAVRRLPGTDGVLGLVATLAFAVVYVAYWAANQRRRRTRLEMAIPLEELLPWLLVMVGLGAAMVACLGQAGLTSVVYLTVSVVIAMDEDFHEHLP